MISPDLVKQHRLWVAKSRMEAMILKNCQVLQWNSGNDSEDISLTFKTATKTVPYVLHRGTVLLRKINLILGDLWSIKDLTEHFTNGNTLTSVSWPVLVKTSPEHFGSSFVIFTLSWVPGFLLVSYKFKWLLTTQGCIGFGLKISSLLALLPAVHWEIHQRQMGFGLFWCCQVSGSYLNSKDRSGNQKAT